MSVVLHSCCAGLFTQSALHTHMLNMLHTHTLRLRRQHDAAARLPEGLLGEADVGLVTSEESEGEVSYYTSKRADVLKVWVWVWERKTQ